jgi:O-antigen/teichoic acid export membrane protein
MNRSLGRKVSILLSGSVAAQALPLLAAPLLARLYAPDAFGEFGLYVAVTSILAAFANLKYDHAVLLAKNSVAAFHVFVICVMSTATIAVLMSLVILLAPDAWFGSRLFSVNRTHAVWLPVSFILASLTQALISILFRGEQFGAVAKVRVSNAVMTTGFTLSLGFWMPTGTALIVSSIAGQGFGVAMLLLLRDSSQPFFTSLRWSLLARCSTRYRRFPVFTAPSDLLNALATNLPLLFIGSIYGVATAGAYALAQRTLGMPLMLIGAAFCDAYRQSAAKSFAEEGSYWRITIRTFRTLGLIAIVPAVVCAMSAPWLFAIVFGEQWALTGEIVQMLTAVYFFRFLVSPLSYNFYLANRHSEDLMLQCLGFASTCALFLYVEKNQIPFSQVLIIYSALSCGIYFLYGIRSLEFASATKNRNYLARR